MPVARSSRARCRRGCVTGGRRGRVGGRIVRWRVSARCRYLVPRAAAWAEARILARRRPIADVIADPRTTPTRATELAARAGRAAFAADSLGLDAGRSFTTYTALEHDTLVLVLSGAYRDRLRPVTWWFPIVGTRAL